MIGEGCGVSQRTEGCAPRCPGGVLLPSSLHPQLVLVSQRLLLKTRPGATLAPSREHREQAVIGARCSPHSPASSGTGAAHADHLCEEAPTQRFLPSPAEAGVRRAVGGTAAEAESGQAPSGGQPTLNQDERHPTFRIPPSSHLDLSCAI